MAKTPDVLLGHEADGIQEFDNPLPGWWLGILWGSIAFTIAFIPYLSATNWSSGAQYEAEIAVAEALHPKAEPTPATAAVAWASTPALVTAGTPIFAARCLPCHGPDGKGLIGPDLTDSEWIHGGTLGAIEATVTHGVPEKGMMAWTPILDAEEIRQVTAFVHALGGGQ